MFGLTQSQQLAGIELLFQLIIITTEFARKMSLLSSDILHQVFKFFVSDNQLVDGESLRVASLVCKQWRGIVNSKALWATSVGATESNGGSNSVHQSLQLKEGDANEAILHASLIGFTNLKCYGNDFPESEVYFHVRERATGSKYLLSISGNNKKNPSLIRDIYANHFELKEDFLLRDSSNGKKLLYPSQRCPLGITVWKGRVLRWYRSDSETEASETIAQISSKREIQLFKEISEREKLFAYVNHLIDLENTYSRRSDNDLGFYARGPAG